MSGPKTFAARMEAALNEILELQTKVHLRFSELFRMRIQDQQRGITINCSEDIRILEERVRQALEPYTVMSRVLKSESQSTREMSNKKTELQNLIDDISKVARNFANQQEDYEAYVGYEQTVNAFNKTIEDKKSSAKQLIEKYAPAAQPEKTQQLIQAVQDIKSDYPLAKFELDFRKKKIQLDAQLQDRSRKAEESIVQILSCVSPPSVQKPGAKQANNISSKIEKRIRQINELIAESDNPHQAFLYKQRLEELKHSETFREEYFYIELLEDIRQANQTLRLKQQVKKILSRLNVAAMHSSLGQKQKELIAKAIELIERAQIRENEFQDFEFRSHQLLKQNEELVSQELIKEKERQYIKAQIIESLRVRRYEVVEESEVVDFEKENDFLMKIPGQSNLLNIRFNEDGTFLYNFLIPENKSELGIGQTQQKLSEMMSTCGDFKEMLAELAAAGLNVTLTKEKEASESALIQIPAKLKTRLDSTEQRKSKKAQLQERTLKR